MNESKDLFDDSVMTFGEHLEVLRVHLIRAILGLVAAVVVALFFGQIPIDIMRRPLDDALRDYGIQQTKADEESEEELTGINFWQTVVDWWNGESSDDGQPKEPERETLSAAELRRQLEEGERTPENTFNVRIGLERIRFQDRPAPKPTPKEKGTASSEKSGDAKPSSEEPQPDSDTTYYEVDVSKLPDADVAELGDLLAAKGIAAPLAADLVGSTIRVRVPVKDVARALNEIDPEAFDEPADDEDRAVELELVSRTFARLQDQIVEAGRPKAITLTVQEAFMTYVKVAVVTGLIISGPWIFYQIWLFVAAGLYPHERTYVYTYLPMSLLLFVSGVLLCYFGVLPLVLDFLFTFNTLLGVEPQIRLTEWINFAIVLPLMFGISFQLPLVMLFLERISIFQVNNYQTQRRMAILVIAILSMLLTPADPASMLMMMIPLIFLYELGILLCKWSPAKPPIEGAEPV